MVQRPRGGEGEGGGGGTGGMGGGDTLLNMESSEEIRFNLL
jgi:hypothetical protein